MTFLRAWSTKQKIPALTQNSGAPGKAELFSEQINRVTAEIEKAKNK